MLLRNTKKFFKESFLMYERRDKQQVLLQIHNSCLGIVKEIDDICRANDLKYSLCGGSVIGAHLYGGFIPWDDDIDLMMTRQNYDVFIKKFQKMGAKQYKILNYHISQRAAVPTLFTRIEDTNTAITEVIAGNVRKGHTFVDITVMDNVSSKLNHKIAFIYGSYVYSRLYKWNGMIPHTGWKKILFKFVNTRGNEKRTLNLYSNYEHFCKKRSHKKTAFCAELMSAAYSKFLYERSLFDEYVDVNFAGLQLMVVKRYMDYLYMRYGKRTFDKDVPSEQRYNSHIIEFQTLGESVK